MAQRGHSQKWECHQSGDRCLDADSIPEGDDFPGAVASALAGVKYFIYSTHASDPACGKLLNSFDLVRVHKFGDLEDKASFKAMAKFAEAEDWTKGLQWGKDGILENNLQNITHIIANDPILKGIVFNQLAHQASSLQLG